MSVSISIVAQRKLTSEDFENVKLYNSLIERGYDIPDKLRKDLDYLIHYEDELITTGEGYIVEMGLDGKGDVMYGDGMIIPISSLPLNTVAIRVYAVA